MELKRVILEIDVQTKFGDFFYFSFCTPPGVPTSQTAALNCPERFIELIKKIIVNACGFSSMLPTGGTGLATSWKSFVLIQKHLRQQLCFTYLLMEPRTAKLTVSSRIASAFYLGIVILFWHKLWKY